MVYLGSKRATESFRKRIRVETNDPKHANETLVCEGQILQPMEIKPNRVNFGTIARNSATQHRTVTLLRADGGPISPEAKPGKVEGLDAQICEIEPGDRYELEISVGPPWPQGPFKEILYLKTGLEVSPEALLLITGTVAQRLTAVPSRLILPTPQQDEESEGSVRLKWSEDRKPAQILEVKCSIPEANARVEERDGNQMLVVTVPPGSERVRGSYTARIKTDDQEVPTFSVPIMFRPQRSSQRGTAGKGPTGKSLEVIQRPVRAEAPRRKEE